MLPIQSCDQLSRIEFINCKDGKLKFDRKKFLCARISGSRSTGSTVPRNTT